MFSIHTFLSDLLSVRTENGSDISARFQKLGCNMGDFQEFSKKLCFGCRKHRFVFCFLIQIHTDLCGLKNRLLISTKVLKQSK